jgi:tetratricopeptide (TPR) repeat protein
MLFRPAKCPTCQGELQVPTDREMVKCMYCGADIVVRQVLQNASAVSAENLINIARAAYVAGNYEESYTYYTRALEIEPHNPEAWFGKGQSAGCMSTLRDFRIPEMIVGFQKAIDHSQAAEKPKIQELAVNAINNIVIAYYNAARKHLHEYVALNNVWDEYLKQCTLILEALELAHYCDPRNKITIDFIIFICKDNIEGIKFQDPYDNYTTKIYRLSDRYETQLRSHMVKYAQKMRELDPAYVAPQANRPSSSGCFIATAVLNSYDHPTVILLRSFRDEWLLKHRLGRAFIKQYYKFGPYLAKCIKEGDQRKRLCYVFIIIPLSFLARAVMRSKGSRRQDHNSTSFFVQ